MDKIESINKKELAKYLKVWFDEVDLLNKNIWERDPVANLLKRELKLAGRWRFRPRGDAKKGYEAFLKSKVATKSEPDNW